MKKKIRKSVLLAVCAMSLAACGGKGAETEETQKNGYTMEELETAENINEYTMKEIRKAQEIADQATFHLVDRYHEAGLTYIMIEVTNVPDSLSKFDSLGILCTRDGEKLDYICGKASDTDSFLYQIGLYGDYMCDDLAVVLGPTGYEITVPVTDDFDHSGLSKYRADDFCYCKTDNGVLGVTVSAKYSALEGNVIVRARYGIAKGDTEYGSSNHHAGVWAKEAEVEQGSFVMMIDGEEYHPRYTEFMCFYPFDEEDNDLQKFLDAEVRFKIDGVEFSYKVKDLIEGGDGAAETVYETEPKTTEEPINEYTKQCIEEAQKIADQTVFRLVDKYYMEVSDKTYVTLEISNVPDGLDAYRLGYLSMGNETDPYSIPYNTSASGYLYQGSVHGDHMEDEVVVLAGSMLSDEMEFAVPVTVTEDFDFSRLSDYNTDTIRYYKTDEGVIGVKVSASHNGSEGRIGIDAQYTIDGNMTWGHAKDAEVEQGSFVITLDGEEYQRELSNGLLIYPIYGGDDGVQKFLNAEIRFKIEGLAFGYKVKDLIKEP